MKHYDGFCLKKNGQSTDLHDSLDSWLSVQIVVIIFTYYKSKNTIKKEKEKFTLDYSNLPQRRIDLRQDRLFQYISAVA